MIGQSFPIQSNLRYTVHSFQSTDKETVFQQLASWSEGCTFDGIRMCSSSSCLSQSVITDKWVRWIKSEFDYLHVVLGDHLMFILSRYPSALTKKPLQKYPVTCKQNNRNISHPTHFRNVINRNASPITVPRLVPERLKQRQLSFTKVLFNDQHFSSSITDGATFFTLSAAALAGISFLSYIVIRNSKESYDDGNATLFLEDDILDRRLHKRLSDISPSTKTKSALVVERDDLAKYADVVTDTIDNCLVSHAKPNNYQ